MDVKDTSAIVTGGASGLGAATSRHLADNGAHVTIVDRQEELGEQLAAELGRGAKFVAADVTSEAEVTEAIAIAAADAPLRVVVNCAGIGSAARTVGRDGSPAPLDGFRKVIDVNLVGTFNVTSRAASIMSTIDPLAHGERGVIVATASVAAFDGQIGQAAYSASKGGIVGMTLPIARDLSNVGIRMVTIAPGIIGKDPDTGDESGLLAQLPDDVRESLAAGVPFPKRIGRPSEYASLVLEIVRNGYLNGEVIRLDGALRMAPR